MNELTASKSLHSKIKLTLTFIKSYLLYLYFDHKMFDCLILQKQSDVFLSCTCVNL